MGDRRIPPRLTYMIAEIFVINPQSLRPHKDFGSGQRKRPNSQLDKDNYRQSRYWSSLRGWVASVNSSGVKYL